MSSAYQTAGYPFAIPKSPQYAATLPRWPPTANLLG